MFVSVTGAEKAGLPGVSHGLFERGEVELVEFFYRSANEQLRGVLAQKCAEKYDTTVVHSLAPEWISLNISQ